MSLQDFDIVVNENNFEDAIKSVINELREYVEDYFNEYEYWSTDKERNIQLSKLNNLNNCKLKIIERNKYINEES